MKIALLGTHGVGKTTLAYGLASRLKRKDVSLDIVHEVARRCPLPLNEDTTADAQQWILHNQIAEEIVAAARYPVVLCDRSVLDNFVYLLLAAGDHPYLQALVDAWLPSYDLLVYVPIVTTPQPDGIRALSPSFQLEVDQRLRQEIADRGLRVHFLPSEDRKVWIDQLDDAAQRLLRSPQMTLFANDEHAP